VMQPGVEFWIEVLSCCELCQKGRMPLYRCKLTVTKIVRNYLVIYSSPSKDNV